MHFNGSSESVISSVKVEVLDIFVLSGAFRCVLTQQHNLPKRTHPIKVSPRSDLVILRETAIKKHTSYISDPTGIS